MTDNGDTAQVNKPWDGRVQLEPLDHSREARSADDSGTPVGFINAAIRRGEVLRLTRHVPGLLEANVQVEFPLGSIWQQQSGCARFVQFRKPMAGTARYGLVE